MVVLEQELRDLWLGGRGLLLCVAFSGLLSVIAYLVATNTALNFLEQRESVNLTLQVAVAVGALLALLAAADAVSGERERGTLESLLLTPVSRVEIITGKLLAALSLWFAAFAITVPYVWFLGRGVGIVGDALGLGFVVGTLLAIPLASLGIADQRLLALQPRQPLGQPLPPARTLRSDAASLERAAGLGRRPAASYQPAHCRRALRRQHRRRRARLVRGCALASLAARRGRRPRLHRRGRRRAGAATVGSRLMRNLLCLVVATAVLVVAADASAADRLAVNADQTRVVTELGHTFSFRTTITNEGTEIARGYVAHLNVLSYDPGVYVDPEDWSGNRTRYLQPILRGGSATITWRMQAVNDGHFAVYVAVLPQTGGGRPTTGPVITVTVAKRTTINSGGILPLALGVPALLGVAWLGLRTQRRRSSSPSHRTDVPSADDQRRTE